MLPFVGRTSWPSEAKRTERRLRGGSTLFCFQPLGFSALLLQFRNQRRTKTFNRVKAVEDHRVCPARVGQVKKLVPSEGEPERKGLILSALVRPVLLEELVAFCSIALRTRVLLELRRN